MSIMGCYQDERAVENELGGKWEKLYEYTFEEEHSEGFEFPHDLDGTPLNLNGIMILISGFNISSPLQLKINDITFLNEGTSTLRENVFKLVIKNGCTDGIWKSGSDKGILRSPYTSFNMLATFIDFIHSFTFSLTGNENGKVEFYVLRGV